VIVIGRTLQEHLTYLLKVFQRFREACLKLTPGKCELFQKEVRYLEKLKAVREWPIPKNKDEIRTQNYWDLDFFHHPVF
jgi:hypothetical protein